MTLLYVAAGLVVFLGLIVLFYVSRMKMPAPGEALVVFGALIPEGKKVVTKGSVFVWPGIQRYAAIPLNVIKVSVDATIRTKDGIFVNIVAPCVMKVNSLPEAIHLASEMFPAGKVSLDTAADIMRNLLEGQFRDIATQMDLSELNENRSDLLKKIEQIAQAEFSKMGLQIVTVNIEKIDDPQTGILKLKGSQQAAEQNAATQIGIANANRDAAQQTAEANKLAEIAKITASQQLADAQKGLDLKQALNQQEVQTANAITKNAYRMQELQVEQELAQREAAVKITKTQREADVADQQRILTQKNLLVTIEEPALAEKRRVQILAEAQVQEAEQVGRALLLRRDAEGSAEAKYAQTIAVGKAEAAKTEGQAQADVITRTGAAQADAIKSKGLAEAEVGAAQAKVIRERGTAEADIVAKQGLANAEVTKAMAEADRLKGLAEAEVTEKIGLAQAEVTERTGLAEALVIREKGLSDAAGREALMLAEVTVERSRAEYLRDTMTDEVLKYHLIQKMPEIIAAFAGVYPKFGNITVVDMGGADGSISAVDKFGMSMTRSLGALFPMIQGMTGVNLGEALQASLQSDEARAAAAANGLDAATLTQVSQVLETIQFPGGKSIPVATIQRALNANPELAKMVLPLIGAADDAAATTSGR